MFRNTLSVVGALALVVAILLVSSPVQVLASNQPVVYAVLFFSPQCPHCHTVITEELPKMQNEFGEQFQLVFIDITTPEGQQLFASAIQTFSIPPEMQGVPLMIIGDEVLVGAIDIPQRAPALVRQKLAEGGIGFPDFPGLAEFVGDTMPEPEEVGEPEPLTLSGRLARDPVGNALAILVLLGLVASAVAVIFPGVRAFSASDERPLSWLSGKPGRLVAWIVALAGFLVAGSLVSQKEGDAFSMLPALGSALTLFAVFLVIIRRRPQRRGRSRRSKKRSAELPGWLIPLVVFAGLLVAVYLSYVEVGHNWAICGAVGDCNTVQQSVYARLFGVLPIGVLGIIGYVVIFLAWFIAQITEDKLSDLAHAALLGISLIGVLFSIYLTFLEPFVIGATCAWCLTSAITMILLLWLSAAPGWRALLRLSGELANEESVE